MIFLLYIFFDIKFFDYFHDFVFLYIFVNLNIKFILNFLLKFLYQNKGDSKIHFNKNNKGIMIDVLLGLQFGDEGKGKIIDYLSNNYDVIARFNGGNNAGHTIFYNNKKYALHIIPSGIFYGKMCIIGNGAIIDPVSLKKEIELLENDGIDVKSNLYISKFAHIITPYHIAEDIEKEKTLKIGTTKKGIGPCYTDKISRKGTRVCDINTEFIENYADIDFQESLKFLLTLKIANIISYLNDKNIEILAEGAQGTLLDIEFGTYPYVTSSSTTIGSVMTGLGVSNKNINKVYGVFKAYMTRVGNGPFVTELKGKIGDKIRQAGNEFGSTTGRPRRCGWLDLPTLRYACMINGVTNLVMTKSDVLNDFDEIKVCIGYSFIDSVDNEEYSIYDYDNTLYNNNAKPIYKKFKGWNTINNKESLEEFIQYIENEIGIPITLVSIGKNRDEIYERY